jgi:NTE family protein
MSDQSKRDEATSEATSDVTHDASPKSTHPAAALPLTAQPVMNEVETSSRRPTAPRGPEEGIALCLSGGGYRAMLFHLGALWRLNEAGILARLKRVSSVSGGSIVAALLGLRWRELGLDRQPAADSADFERLLVAPVRDMAQRNIDIASSLGGVLGPGNAGDWIAAAYDKHLFAGATLQELPDEPRFVINATNVQTGVLWRFMKPAMRDYKIGEVKNPDTRLAIAVAASSAFPPFLSPVVLDLDPALFEPGSGLQKPGTNENLFGDEFRREVILTDGGIYDNLGLETAWKRYRTILVSDGGGRIQENPDPKRDWARHTADVLSWVDSQVRSLRKRQVIGSYQSGASFEQGRRTGTYWGIGTHIDDYGLADALLRDEDKQTDPAKVPTRLKRLDDVTQEHLINWGYAVCDAAIRRHFNGEERRSRPAGLVYPSAGI